MLLYIMSKLKPELLPFVESAKQSYLNECYDMPETVQREKKAFSRTKYYDMLLEVYKGRLVKQVAFDKGLKYNTIYSSLMETQNRVENFAKWNGLL